MKVIPNEIFITDSSAEKHIHKLLKKIQLSDYDIALHSLNIGKHAYKKWAEGDFLILSQKGILLLEVKGGRIKCNNGIWTYIDRYEKRSSKRESPAAQAKSAYFSLRKSYLDEKYAGIMDNITSGFACVIKDLDSIVGLNEKNLSELPYEITAYKKDIVTASNFREKLLSILNYWDTKSKKSQINLTKDEIIEISNYLRPNFDKQPSLGHQIEDFDNTLITLTQNQIGVISGLEDNERVMVSGGAGTGKTICAMAIAKGYASDQKKVLFLTRSQNLASYLKQTPKIPDTLFIKTLNEIKSQSYNELYDVLIVDEGQDLCQMSILNVLEKFLKNGLENGSWRWFLDKDHQISPSFSFEKEAYNYLELMNPVKYKLKDNIRNTKKIISHVEIFSKVKMEENPKGFGGNFYYESRLDFSSKVKELITYLKNWLSNEVKKNNICILTPDMDMAERLKKNLLEHGYRTELVNTKTFVNERESIQISTVEDFKGLEKEIICIFGIPDNCSNETLKKYFYKSITRAIHTVLIINEKEEKQILFDIGN